MDKQEDSHSLCTTTLGFLTCLEEDGIYELPSIPPFSLIAGKSLDDVWQCLPRLAQARPGAKEENAFFRLEFPQGPRNDGESDNLHPGSKHSPFTYAVEWSERAIVPTQLLLGIYQLGAVSVFCSCILSCRTHRYSPILYPALKPAWSACCLSYPEFKDAAQSCLFSWATSLTPGSVRRTDSHKHCSL